jgi:hypothetical protein
VILDAYVPFIVTPAKAGVHLTASRWFWIPAFAGMTIELML